MVITIDRSQWFCGHGSGFTRLRICETTFHNGDFIDKSFIGFKDCFGFIAEQSGIQNIDDVKSPCDFREVPEIFQGLVYKFNGKFYNNDLCQRIITLNDDQSVNKYKREAKIASLFKKLNIQIGFTNKYENFRQMESYKKQSKFLSLILRHKPEEIGITLNSNGYANVAELCKKSGITSEVLDEIVKTDAKGRYEFDETKKFIRACQGHSIDVDPGIKIDYSPPCVLYHGTSENVIEKIMASGLDKMQRKYVHLSADIDTAFKVGSRHGKPVILVVDVESMIADGLKIYKSNNSVYLSDNIPAKYLRKHSG